MKAQLHSSLDAHEEGADAPSSRRAASAGCGKSALVVFRRGERSGQDAGQGPAADKADRGDRKSLPQQRSETTASPPVPFYPTLTSYLAT